MNTNPEKKEKDKEKILKKSETLTEKDKIIIEKSPESDKREEKSDTVICIYGCYTDDCVIALYV